MATLFQFKAGRVDLNEETGLATPLRGQGRVVVKPSSEDASLVAIQWQPRGSYLQVASSEELVLLPGDAEFEHVPECKLGRVIMMRMQSSGMRVLYWLQDPPKGDLDKLSDVDEEIVLKLNELANQELEEPEEDVSMDVAPTEVPADASTGGRSEESTQVPKETPAQTGTAEHSAESMDVDDEERPATSGPPQTQQRLSQLVDTQRRAAHVTVAGDAELNALLQHVPDVARSRSELVEVVHSPHFSHALDELGMAVLESPALARELGLPRQPRTVAEFLTLLQAMYRDPTQGPN